jgi:transketolase
MPCQELFDQQSNSYQQKIINETKNIISIEAASTDCWKKYIGKDGLSFGIDTFGKSAPYKKIYKHFGLTSANIANKSKRLLRKKI